MSELGGRVAIVTGAGSGLGRQHALALAAHGASVVVNDLDDGGEETVSMISEAGGSAVFHRSDVADWDAGGRLVGRAVETFGDLHIVVNNAGILRDRMIFSMVEDEWDAVIRVHLKGHAVTCHHAAVHWRAQAKAGATAPRRVVNTSSESGIFGGAGQANYGAAKGGILTLTIVLARELEKYGVTVNSIAPRARTSMTDYLPYMAEPEDPDTFDRYDPANVSPLVVWLCTDDAADVNGQTFIVGGSGIFLMQRFTQVAEIRKDAARFTVDDIRERREELFAGRESGIPTFDVPKF